MEFSIIGKRKPHKRDDCAFNDEVQRLFFKKILCSLQLNVCNMAFKLDLCEPFAGKDVIRH
jgi:hypothetical protein